MSALSARGSTRTWRKIRAYVLERDAFACRFIDPDRPGGICGAYATHVHHTDPRAAGGTDDPARLVAACAAHNLSKGADPGLEPRAPRPAGRRPGRPSRTPEWSW